MEVEKLRSFPDFLLAFLSRLSPEPRSIQKLPVQAFGFRKLAPVDRAGDLVLDMPRCQHVSLHLRPVHHAQAETEVPLLNQGPDMRNAVWALRLAKSEKATLPA